jgi:hypothetical protein
MVREIAHQMRKMPQYSRSGSLGFGRHVLPHVPFLVSAACITPPPNRLSGHAMCRTHFRVVTLTRSQGLCPAKGEVLNACDLAPVGARHPVGLDDDRLWKNVYRANHGSLKEKMP